MDETTIEAIWTVDSETGDEYLIDLITNKVLARRGFNGEIIH